MVLTLYAGRKFRNIHFQHLAFEKVRFVFKYKVAQRHAGVVQHAQVGRFFGNIEFDQQLPYPNALILMHLTFEVTDHRFCEVLLQWPFIGLFAFEIVPDQDRYDQVNAAFDEFDERSGLLRKLKCYLIHQVTDRLRIAIIFHWSSLAEPDIFAQIFNLFVSVSKIRAVCLFLLKIMR